MTSLMTTKKSEASAYSTPSSNDAGTVKVTKLTKPAKVPSQTKDMSLETYTTQLTTWQDINEDVPEYVKYHDLIEDMKRNKDIKGLQRYIADHILPVLTKKTDQTVDKVAGLLDMEDLELKMWKRGQKISSSSERISMRMMMNLCWP